MKTKKVKKRLYRNANGEVSKTPNGVSFVKSLAKNLTKAITSGK